VHIQHEAVSILDSWALAQTCNFQYILSPFVFHTYFFNLSVAPITSLMDNSEHGDEAEIAAFTPNSPGQPRRKHQIQDTAPHWQGAVPESSDESTREQGGLSTNQTGSAFFHYHTWMQNLMLLPVNVSAAKKRRMVEQSLKTLRAIKRRRLLSLQSTYPHM